MDGWGLKNAITKVVIYRDMNKAEHLQRIILAYVFWGGLWGIVGYNVLCLWGRGGFLGNAHNGAYFVHDRVKHYGQMAVHYRIDYSVGCNVCFSVGVELPRSDN